MPSEKSKEQLDDDILETVYPNDNAEITGGGTQTLLRNINESAVNKISDADKLVTKGSATFDVDDLDEDGNYEYVHNSGTPYPTVVSIWGPDGTPRNVPWRPKDGTSPTTLVVLFGGSIDAGTHTIKHIC